MVVCMPEGLGLNHLTVWFDFRVWFLGYRRGRRQTRHMSSWLSRHYGAPGETPDVGLTGVCGLPWLAMIRIHLLWDISAGEAMPPTLHREVTTGSFTPGTLLDPGLWISTHTWFTHFHTSKHLGCHQFLLLLITLTWKPVTCSCLFCLVKWQGSWR